MQSQSAIGFVGLGVMGEPMCRNLLSRTDRPVVAYDIRTEVVDRLGTHGAIAARSVAEVAERAEVILISMPGGPELKELMTGPSGILSVLGPGRLIVDHTTAPLELTRELGLLTKELGSEYCDAPIARTRQAAADGTLSIMVGGSSAAFEAARPVLEMMATDITHCGEIGAGQVTKLLNNMVLFQNVRAIAEAHAIATGLTGRFGDELDLDLAGLFGVIAGASGGSFALNNHGMKSVLPGSYPLRAFSTKYALKDLGYALDLAALVGIDAVGALTVQELMVAAKDEGHGDEYFPVMRKVLEPRESMSQDWQPPDSTLSRFTGRLTAVDVHAEGEPGRVIVAGMPELPGRTMLDKARWMEANADHIRLRMLREPNGYPGLCCNAIVPSTDPTADAGYIIMEQTEYPPMSGSNTICVVTALLETGMLPMEEPVTELTLESPAGLITVRADCAGGKVTMVRFRNVPAFAMHLDAPIQVPEIGKVPVDIAWGGMFYAIADGDALGIDLSAANGAEISRVSAMIGAAARQQLPVTHPLEPMITGPTISQLSGAPSVAGADVRNAVTVSTGPVDWNRPETWTGALDRSPCGTGTSAKMAVLHARQELKVGQDFVHEGPLGTTFKSRIIEETSVGPYSAIVSEIGGQGWITGFAEYVLDRTDPFPQGYTIGDIWP